MKSRWMSGCVRSPTHNIHAHYLASSTNIFSQDFVCGLNNDLKFNMEELARELGYTASVAEDGLYHWCNSPGSTVFVLVSVLANLGRTDCVHRIEQYLLNHAMQLYIKVEQAVTDVPPVRTSPQFQQIITCCEFSLLQTLENVLGEALVYYEITGPGTWVMWTTLAKELKGQQLTLLRHSQPVPCTREALCEAMEPDTELKQPVMAQNIPANNCSNLNEETHCKALSCTQIENLKFSQESSIQISNSNNITLSGSLNAERESFGSLSAEGPTKTHSYPTLDSKNYLFTLEQKPHVKVGLVSKQNTPEYAHVKHFPDKHLYKDSISKGNNPVMSVHQVHPMEVLDNVPHLSLLEENCSSLLANSQIPTVQQKKEETQSKLNDLNCVASISKTCDSDTATSTSGVRQIKKCSQLQNLSYSATEVGDPVIQTQIFSGANMAGFQVHPTVFSVFTPERNVQGIHVSTFPSGDVHLSNTGIQPLDGQLQNSSSTLENDTSLPCGNSYFITAPPQKRHRNDHVTTSSVALVEPQHGRHPNLQQQTLLKVQTLKMNQSQQTQRVLASPKMATSDIDHSCAVEGQNHKSYPQQRQYQFYQDAEAHPDSQHGNYPVESSFSKITQNSSQAHMRQISQHLHDHQLLQNQQQSQQELQPSPFLKPTSSPFLICHTPPPSFPDELVIKGNYNVSGIEQRQRTQSQMFHTVYPYKEAAPASQSIKKLGQETEMDTRSEQYMAMSNAVQIPGAANASFKSSSVKSQFSQGKFTKTSHNTEFINGSPQTFPTSGSLFESVFVSGSSGGSTVCPVLTNNDPSAVCTADQNTFITPQPFHPAPPLLDALGRRLNTSVTTQGLFIDEFGRTIQPHRESNSPANDGQFFISRPLTSNHFQALPMTSTLNIEAELLHLDGWCPHENGDTIQRTMEKFRNQDGNYIIWKSRRFQKCIISVSHLNELFHFRIEEMKSEDNSGTVYYLFEGGYASQSLLNLVHHYRQHGIRLSMQSAGKKKTYIENITLHYPLKVKMEMKRKDTSSLNKFLKRKDVSVFK